MGLFGNVKRGVKRAAKGVKTSYGKYQEYSEKVEQGRAKGRVTRLQRLKEETKLARAEAGYYKAKQSVARAKGPQEDLFGLGGGGLFGGGGGLYGPAPAPRKKARAKAKPKAKARAKRKAKGRSVTIRY